MAWADPWTPARTPELLPSEKRSRKSALIVDPQDVSRRATVVFRFPAEPTWDQEVAVFTANRWRGQMQASEEIAPEWHDVDGLPFEEMWDVARHRLPKVLGGERFLTDIEFASDSQTVADADLHEWSPSS